MWGLGQGMGCTGGMRQTARPDVPANHLLLGIGEGSPVRVVAGVFLRHAFLLEGEEATCVLI